MTEMVEVVVGRLGRAHGIRGDVAVELRTDEPELRFIPGASLGVEGRALQLKIASVKWHGDRLIIGFEGYQDRNSIEELRGSLLVVNVPIDESPSDEDEYYDRQLLGLRVLDHGRTEVGTIASVVHLPTQELLAIETPSGEKLVPFVSELVVEVNLSGGFVRLADIEGLLEEVED